MVSTATCDGFYSTQIRDRGRTRGLCCGMRWSLRRWVRERRRTRSPLLRHPDCLCGVHTHTHTHTRATSHVCSRSAASCEMVTTELILEHRCCALGAKRGDRAGNISLYLSLSVCVRVCMHIRERESQSRPHREREREGGSRGGGGEL